MNFKMKDRMIMFMYQLFVGLVILFGVVFCEGLEIYGAEEGLTEDEVKQQIMEIIEAEGEGYSIKEYNIDKLYQTISLDYFINDYIEGMSFEEIVDKQIKRYQELEMEYDFWVLPYENFNNEKCIMVLLEQNGKVEICTRNVQENNEDMKLVDDKYSELSSEELQKVLYINLGLYGFKITYILMKDGTAYVIPYLTENISQWCNLENEALYDLEEFVVVMYNCYQEPYEKDRKNLGFGESFLIQTRKKILKFKDIEQIVIFEKVKEKQLLILFLCILIWGMGIVIVKNIRKRR